MRVITFQSPSGATLDLTPDQIRTLERAAVWPRDYQGQEYCSVSHGLHRGYPSMTDAEIAALVREG